jgi:two-component system chemotaxis response regulator CheY
VQPKKILVVDDSKLMLKMYELMLRSHALVFASDGREALSRLAENPEVDLILLDLNMPVMGGLELLGHLRANGALPRLAVVIVTTDGKEDEIARGLAAGAAAYVTKPFDAEKILRLIASLEQGTLA